LGNALEALVAERYLKALVDVDLELGLDAACGLAPGREAHVVAIAREALSNVVRHSQARKVIVRASSVDDRLQLVIEDNGRGMAGSTQGGSGLRNMRERARLLGGDLDVRAAPSGGTVVALDVPCGEDDERTGSVPKPGR
jgi:two-component system sensor histidine kinase UhpB